MFNRMHESRKSSLVVENLEVVYLQAIYKVLVENLILNLIQLILFIHMHSMSPG